MYIPASTCIFNSCRAVSSRSSAVTRKKGNKILSCISSTPNASAVVTKSTMILMSLRLGPIDPSQTLHIIPFWEPYHFIKDHFYNNHDSVQIFQHDTHEKS